MNKVKEILVKIKEARMNVDDADILLGLRLAEGIVRQFLPDEEPEYEFDRYGEAERHWEMETNR